MFLACTNMIDRRNPSFSKVVTFTSKDSEAGLIQLVIRYQKLINRLNSSDIVFQLVSLSDLTGAVSNSMIVELGAVYLDSQILTNLRSRAKSGDGLLLQLHPLDTLVAEDTIEVEVSEIKDFVYTLPPLPKYTTVTELAVNLKVRELFQISVLFISIDQDGKIYWVMNEKSNPDFITYKKIMLEANREAFLHYNAPTKTYRICHELPEAVTLAQAELHEEMTATEIVNVGDGNEGGSNQDVHASEPTVASGENQ